jgi:hypothetical protein
MLIFSSIEKKYNPSVNYLEFEAIAKEADKTVCPNFKS